MPWQTDVREIFAATRLSHVVVIAKEYMGIVAIKIQQRDRYMPICRTQNLHLASVTHNAIS